MTGSIAFVDLAAQRRRLGTLVEEAVMGVIAHGRFILGPEVAALEAELAVLAGASHCVGCGSGTDALLMAMLALGVRPGDAVLIPSFTFVATAEVVALVGASPVFVDVLPGTFNVNADGLSGAAEEARRAQLRPVGVIAVDMFGQPADYDAVHKAAASEGLWVLADAAQSLGGSSDGRPVGSLARITATSFFPAKPLGCYGDGGALFTDDEELAQTFRSLRVHGQGESKYDNVNIGINGRLDTIQAAVLRAKLTIFGAELQERRALADAYSKALDDVVVTPMLSPGAESSWAQYTVQVDGRDRVAASLTAASVPTAVYYPKPLHRQTAYQAYPRSPVGCPVSDEVCRRVLSLPMHPYLTNEMRDQVVGAVRFAVG